MRSRAGPGVHGDGNGDQNTHADSDRHTDSDTDGGRRQRHTDADADDGAIHDGNGDWNAGNGYRYDCHRRNGNGKRDSERDTIVAVGDGNLACGQRNANTTPNLNGASDRDSDR
jgi:hypothetical protein